MIDFHLSQFIDALADLNVAQTRARMAPPDNFPSDEALDRINENLAPIAAQAQRLDLPTVKGRLARVSSYFNKGAVSTYGALAHEIDEIFNSVERDATEEYFCHYERDMARMIFDIPTEWGIVLSKFPSSQREIETGIDCYAFGDYSGSIFHMMRIAELGLRTIAKERGIKSVGKNKPIEWGTWREVFQAIEAELKILRNKPAGQRRDLALTFYDTALSDLRTLQGLYRDPTMHFREKYDKGEAYSAMFRVKSLLETLSTRLEETKPRKIRWGL